MSVCYLDVNDEITDAIARLRGARDGRVVVVVPPGSRIATSRINFKLLAREADARGLAVLFVSGDAGVRALAGSAGMATALSVAEAEVAMGLPVTGAMPGGSAGGLHPVVAAAPGLLAAAAGSVATAPGSPGPAPDAATRVQPVGPAGPRDGAGSMPPDPSLGTYRSGSPAYAPRGPGGYALTPRVGPGGAAPGSVRDADLDRDADAAAAGRRSKARRRGRGRRAVGLVIRLGILVAVLGAIAYGAYLVLPTATITVQPSTHEIGPLTFNVTADPSVAVTSKSGDTVPAQRLQIPLSATDTFPATGSSVTLTKAAGTVTFTSEDTLFDVPIPAGTTVSTPNGVNFETIAAVTATKATINQPSTVNVAVRAVQGGPAGNVGPGAITVVPQSLASLLIKVNNDQATGGGKRTQTPVVLAKDYTGAVAALTTELHTQLTAALADPNTTPNGLTLYPDTAALGTVTADPLAAGVVGSAVATFQLTLASQATVLAVDTSLVAAGGASQLKAAVPSSDQIFNSTITTQVSAGTVTGDTIVYQVTAKGQAYSPLDEAQLKDLVRGKTVSEARSILAPYGTVDVSVWPDFIPTIPGDTRRIDLTIQDPQVGQ